MYILGIESSKTRGMGHLFRSLLYAEYLKKNNMEFIVLINDDENSVSILKENDIPYEIVDYYDDSDWETAEIEKYHADVWLEDKFETPLKMAEYIKANNILFCTVDEFSDGGELADISFAGMLYLTGFTVRGKKKYCGSEYVILNPDIDLFRQERNKAENLIVSLGGSDPFGATVEVVRELSKTPFNAEIIIGPDFDYRKELDEANIKGYEIKRNVPSLIEEFSKFDFAVTGGGVTCCEANAIGLPCMIIANAPHEIKTAEFMQSKGGSVFAGAHGSWDRSMISKIPDLNIGSMSRAGMKTFDSGAVERIFTIIERERKSL